MGIGVHVSWLIGKERHASKLAHQAQLKVKFQRCVFRAFCHCFSWQFFGHKKLYDLTNLSSIAFLSIDHPSYHSYFMRSWGFVSVALLCGFAVPQTQKTRCTCIDACNCKHPYPCTTDVILQKKVWSCGLSPLNPAIDLAQHATEPWSGSNHVMSFIGTSACWTSVILVVPVPNGHLVGP